MMAEMRGIEIIDVESDVRKHTANDWDLIMSEKNIGLPAPRFVMVDMPDRDGELDHTDVMRGRVSYKNRTLSFSFICTSHQSTWAALVREIAGFVHGKRMKIIDPDDPWNYYIGRCTLGEPTYKGAAIMFLELTVNAEPYRLNDFLTEVNYLITDPTADNTVTLLNDTMPVIPTLSVKGNMTLSFGTYSATLTDGTYRLPGLVLKQGLNDIKITTEDIGSIRFRYRQGAI